MFKKLLSISLLISTFSCFGQTTYDKVIRSQINTGIHANASYRNAAGEYLISGNYSSGESHVSKVDSLGELIWIKTFDKSDQNYLTNPQIQKDKIIQLQDSNYLLTRNIKDWSNNKYKSYLIKFSENGDLIWSKQIHKNYASNTGSTFTLETSNGKLLHAISPSGSGKLDLIVLNSTGTIDTQINLTINLNAEPIAFVKDSNSAYLVLQSDEFKCYIYHFDETGQLIDSKLINDYFPMDAIFYENQLTMIGKNSNLVNFVAKLNYSIDSLRLVNAPPYGENYKFASVNENVFLLSSDFTFGRLTKFNLTNNSFFQYELGGIPVNLFQLDSTRFCVLRNGPTLGLKAFGENQIGISVFDTTALASSCMYESGYFTSTTNLLDTITTFVASFNSSVSTIADTLSLTWLDGLMYTTIGCVDHLGSLDEYDLDAQISLSPNPTNESVTVQANEFLEANIDLYNYQGQILQSVPFSGLNKTLSVLELTNGLYFVRITLPNGLSTTKKLVVKH